ncbi:MAG: transporter [Gemmataceae bacterium]|nr:transporter [Gemmataceae bacterium]
MTVCTALVALVVTGCQAGTWQHRTGAPSTNGSNGTPPSNAAGANLPSTNGLNGAESGDGVKGQSKGPSVLLEWTVGKHHEQEDNGNGDREPPLASDRPDFVEASVNVGAGRIQLEMGYTFIHDRRAGATMQTHSFPEALLRVGLWVDWLELRIGQNLGVRSERSSALQRRDSGAEDLYLGLGVGLTEQKGVFPESRVNLQARVPTGCDAFNDRHFLPGMNFLYGWDVIDDQFTIGASTAWNRQRDDTGQPYIEFSHAVTTGIALTKKLSMYLETFAFFPVGADTALPQYYADGGFTYRVNPDWQLDLRAGVGLNRHADDFFTGAGMVVRY